MQRFLSLVRRAVDKYGMIEDNDKIAVGVSGGKDSLALLCAMAELRRFYPKNFEIKAIILDPYFNCESGDYSKIRELCHRLQVECIIIPTQLYEIIFEVRKENNPCSLCSRMRRGILHGVAKENGCNKIALGHTLDDVIETFYMNLFNCGHLGTFSPVTYLSRRDITVIRPLIYANEGDTRHIVKKYNLPVCKSRCPVDEKTNREETKSLLKELSTRYKSLSLKTLGAIERAEIDGYKTEKRRSNSNGQGKNEGSK